jgi:predicted unusual protein kinase regulating ubiquinone biosynthesis (AarF/ABC1/UbiB family)
VRLDRRRYIRVMLFAWRVIGHLLWWDVLLRRFAPGVAARTAESRWRTIAARFRRLATSQGGVLIKLGQFLSIRVDVLPPCVTGELAGLQDEVEPEPFERIEAMVSAELDAGAPDLLATMEHRPVGAASLAQAHRARLATGEAVVVKVQRPGIETLVETDLAALRAVSRVLRRFGWVRRRVDLDLLVDEFARTTRAELDFLAEGRNTERFAEQFAAVDDVRVPRVHWSHSSARLLTLEDVSGIKITDVAGLEAAGLDASRVASRLVDLYFAQIFVHNFVHADPHPGNLFVRPRPGARSDGAFEIAFVDFGMVAVVPERVREHLREYLIGLATRDAARVVRAYDGAGILLPSADRRRLEQAQAAVMNRFWGVRIGDMQSLALTEGMALAREFGDLLRQMPFQLPADLLFVGRSVGMLSGLATTLDPDYDLWAAIAPYARQLALGDGAAKRSAGEGRLADRWSELEAQARALLQAAAAFGAPARSILALPGELERLLTQAASGQLVLQHDLAPDLRRDVDRLARIARTLVWVLALSATLLAGSVIRLVEGPSLLSNALLAGAGLALLLALVRR